MHGMDSNNEDRAHEYSHSHYSNQKEQKMPTVFFPCFQLNTVYFNVCRGKKVSVVSSGIMEILYIERMLLLYNRKNRSGNHSQHMCWNTDYFM